MISLFPVKEPYTHVSGKSYRIQPLRWRLLNSRSVSHFVCLLLQMFSQFYMNVTSETTNLFIRQNPSTHFFVIAACDWRFGPCLHFPNNSTTPSICLVCLPGSHSSLRFVDRTQLKCFSSFPWSPFKQNRLWWQPVMLKGLFFLLTRSWCSKLLLWHHSCWEYI